LHYKDKPIRNITALGILGKSAMHVIRCRGSLRDPLPPAPSRLLCVIYIAGDDGDDRPGESIYNAPLMPENYYLKHHEGVISMVSNRQAIG
jgi:hypothetical protein